MSLFSWFRNRFSLQFMVWEFAALRLHSFLIPLAFWTDVFVNVPMRTVLVNDVNGTCSATGYGKRPWLTHPQCSSCCLSRTFSLICWRSSRVFACSICCFKEIKTCNVPKNRHARMTFSKFSSGCTVGANRIPHLPIHGFGPSCWDDSDCVDVTFFCGDGHDRCPQYLFEWPIN